MRRDSSSSSNGSSSFFKRLSSIVQSSPSSQSRFGSHSHSQSYSHPVLNSNPLTKPVWLDCDPGHDDAIALLLALHHPDLQLLGVSTVAGNANGKDTFLNAVRLMACFRASPDIPVIRGSDEPLVKQPRIDVEVHGQGGLGGVQGLPSLSSPLCHPWLHPTFPNTSSPTTAPEPSLFLYMLSTIITERLNTGKPPIHLAVTGPMTNVALFVKCYPHLLKGVAQIVLMGGAAGVRGNRGALAEFNIMNDPEAASIVFNTDIKVVMAGLNVTHQAIFTTQLHDRLLASGTASSSSTKRHSRRNSHAAGSALVDETTPSAGSPPLSSPNVNVAVLSHSQGPSDLKRMLSSTLTFFAKTYASEFGFTRGPPVHDMLAVAYIIDSTLFYRRVSSPGDVPSVSMYDADPHIIKDVIPDSSPSSSKLRMSHSNINALGVSNETAHTSANGSPTGSPKMNAHGSNSSSSAKSGIAPKRYRVDVECSEGLACGATVVDFWNDRVEHDGWGRGGKNVEVLENLDCPRLWELFFQVVERAETHVAACVYRESLENVNVSTLSTDSVSTVKKDKDGDSALQASPIASSPTNMAFSTKFNENVAVSNTSTL